MSSQMPYINDMAKTMTANCFAVDGYEADDVINSVVNRFSDGKSTFYILSGDKDLFQLFTYDNVSFVKEEKEFVTLFTKDDFIKKYTLQPVQWVDYKALIGDGSDNFAGVPGVGPVTANKLLTSCGSLYNIVKKLGLDGSSFNPYIIDNQIDDFFNDKKNEKLIEKLKENYETLVQSYMLSKLVTCDFTDQQLSTEFKFENIIPTLDTLGMHSLVKYYNTNFASMLIQEELF
jgi:5'-3' exonuclease